MLRATKSRSLAASASGRPRPPSTGATASVGGGAAGPAERSIIDVTVPLHLAPVGNRREHPMARARRTRREISVVLKALAGHQHPPLPIIVTFVRTGWNALDPDGLVAAMKAPIDALAEWFNVNDRDGRLLWRLSQLVTRETRFIRGHREAAASLRIIIRSWDESDGKDPLRVLAVGSTATALVSRE